MEDQLRGDVVGQIAHHEHRPIEAREGEAQRVLLDDLELLEGLADSDPDASDVNELGVVLTRRIIELLENEERAFYRPLLRFGHSPSAGHGVSRR